MVARLVLSAIAVEPIMSEEVYRYKELQLMADASSYYYRNN